MQTMKAIAVVGPGQVRVVDDVPVPEVGDYEVLAKVHACGFCSGTDFQIINGTISESEGFFGFPTILGHEGAGEVVQLGKKVRNYRLGDRVIHPNLRPEVGNGYTKTFGGMAQYGLINDNEAMLEDGLDASAFPFAKQGRFPGEMDYVDAGVLLSLSECHSAARNFGAGPGMDVLVYGAGPMGMALSMFMKLNGVDSVTQIDSVPARLEKAQLVAKVDRVINFAQEDVDTALAGQAFDLVVDAVGASSILLEGSQRLKPGGKVCSLGVLKHEDRMIDASKLKVNTALHMLNFPYGEYAIMDKTARMILDGTVNPKDFYSHVLPYTEIEQAMELVRSKTALKVILTFD